jgi:hypothetical protein
MRYLILSRNDQTAKVAVAAQVGFTYNFLRCRENAAVQFGCANASAATMFERANANAANTFHVAGRKCSK